MLHSTTSSMFAYNGSQKSEPLNPRASEWHPKPTTTEDTNPRSCLSQGNAVFPLLSVLHPRPQYSNLDNPSFSSSMNGTANSRHVNAAAATSESSAQPSNAFCQLEHHYSLSVMYRDKQNLSSSATGKNPGKHSNHPSVILGTIQLANPPSQPGPEGIFSEVACFRASDE
jgi:hypothetical protein